MQHPEITQTVIPCAADRGTPSPKVLQRLRTVTNPNATAAQIRTTRKETFFAPHSDPRPSHLGWPRSAASRSWPAASASTSRSSRPADGPYADRWGKPDIIAPPSIGHGLRAKYVRRITDHEVDGAGHAMIIEKTREVAATILAYLAKHRIYSGKR